MPRFVILRHETPPGYARATHWDLMLECAGVLRTWALPEPPSPDCELVAEELPDHRLAYLDYEGDVSGNRGRVTRWDAGTYEVLCGVLAPAERPEGRAPEEPELRITLRGDKLVGKVTFNRVGGSSPQGADASCSPGSAPEGPAPRYWSITWKGS
jgi:hypothetical protein